jgi:hypothetical protein
MRGTAPAFLYFLDKAIVATKAAIQLEAVEDCISSLLHDMAGPLREQTQAVLAKELGQQPVQNMRRRRLLEFCASVVFDKTGLPREDGEFPEFLWHFAIPFTVTFAPDGLAQNEVLENCVVDVEAILAEAEHSGYLNPRSVLYASSRLFKREDLQYLGPRELSLMFLHAVLNNEDIAVPLPLMLDPQMDTYRSVTMVVLASARLPVGATTLFHPEQAWPAEEISRVVWASLLAQGVKVESVKGHAPARIHEVLSHSMNLFRDELSRNLAAAKAEQQVQAVGIRYFARGYAEIIGMLPCGTAAHLIPAFSFFETQDEVTNVVKAIAVATGLGFFGAMTPAQSPSVALH